jgi:hypothetical protein
MPTGVLPILFFLSVGTFIPSVYSELHRGWPIIAREALDQEYRVLHHQEG